MKTRADVAKLLKDMLHGPEFGIAFDRVSAELDYLREAGQKEYAHDDNNALANFERTGVEIEVSREKVLWIFAKKHLDGILAWINGHRSQREDVRGRIGDVLVYFILLRALVDDTWDSQQNMQK